MLNSGLTRAASRLKSRCNLIVLGESVDGSQLARRNVGQTRQKMRLAKGEVYKRQVEQFYPKYSGQIKPSSYLLLSIPAGAFCLGVWQIQRYNWKVDLIEKMQNRLSAEPIELPSTPEELEDKEYYPVKVRGKFLHNLEFTAGLRSYVEPGGKQKMGLLQSNSTSPPGFHVITPFKLEDRDEIILVNRGWVPTKYRYPIARKEGQIDGPVEITGIVRLTEKRPTFVPNNVPERGMWFYRDVDAMAKSVGASPVYIEQTYDDSLPPNAPIGGQTRMTYRNDHLSYIATWFGLSIACSYMWYTRYLKKRPLI